MPRFHGMPASAAAVGPGDRDGWTWPSRSATAAGIALALTTDRPGGFDLAQQA